MTARLFAALMLTAQPALAENVRDCDTSDRVELIAEPWEENTATFSNGAIRVAVLDRVEPAVASMHLLVLTPPTNEAGMRVCKVISADAAGKGFAFIDFVHRKVGYDPAAGVTVEMEVTPADPAVARGRLLVTMSQDRGRVTARMLR